MNSSSILLLFLFFGVPLILTVFNLYNFFSKKKFKPNAIDRLIFILGIIFSWIMYEMFDSIYFSRWMQSEYESSVYKSVFQCPYIVFLAALAVIGFTLLRISKIKLPRSIMYTCMITMGIGIIISLVWTIQLVSWISSDSFIPKIALFLCLFPFNYTVSSVTLLRKEIKDISVLPATELSSQ